MRRKYTGSGRRGPRRYRRTAGYGDDQSPRHTLRAPRNSRRLTMISWMRPYDTEVDPFEKLAVVDYGDLFFDFGRPETVPDAIEEHASSIISQGPGLLTLGGDHFIAWPLLKAHAKKHGKPLSLLHFDAHSDTWEDEEGRVDHGTMFWQRPKRRPGRSRDVCADRIAHDAIGHAGIQYFRWPVCSREWRRSIVVATPRNPGKRPVYLSFDIDCLDPSYAPGTGTPVCGGLTSHQAIAILRGLSGINLVGMDLVEVAPAYDVGEITALAASHAGHGDVVCEPPDRPVSGNCNGIGTYVVLLRRRPQITTRDMHRCRVNTVLMSLSLAAGLPVLRLCCSLPNAVTNVHCWKRIVLAGERRDVMAGS